MVWLCVLIILMLIFAHEFSNLISIHANLWWHHSWCMHTIKWCLFHQLSVKKHLSTSLNHLFFHLFILICLEVGWCIISQLYLYFLTFNIPQSWRPKEKQFLKLLRNSCSSILSTSSLMPTLVFNNYWLLPLLLWRRLFYIWLLLNIVQSNTFMLKLTIAYRFST